MTRTPEEAVRGLWRTLSARDYDGIADWVTDDCIYLDMPVGPALAARGPADIAKRLQVGWGGLAAYENHDGLVHQVRNGRVCLWKDYWDYGAIMNNAPASWVESLATADTSWVYDATGQV
jgi:limonene-1,2-epoxide hydrolase